MSKKILYLGLELPSRYNETDVLHYPIIKIVPRDPQSVDIQESFSKIRSYTHFVFTSKSAVRLFLDYLKLYHYNIEDVKHACGVAVGKSTAAAMQAGGLSVNVVAKDETAEGIIKEFSSIDLHQAYLFWPHAALSRPILTNYFQKNNISYQDCILYDTVSNICLPLPNLSDIREIIFTSPSTVSAFLNAYQEFPKDIKLTPIGPITAQEIENSIYLSSYYS